MKIKRKDLTLEIQALLKDEFVAEITENNGTLILKFLSGQQFRIVVEEI